MVKTITALVYIYVFNIILTCSHNKESAKQFISDNKDYHDNYIKFDSVKITKDTVNGNFFGIKADFNGISGTDNREALQIAVDYCSKHKKTLLLPKGKILLNSFGISKGSKAHGNIIDLKSNTKIVGNFSELIIGNMFDDRNFIVFSGYDSDDPNASSEMSNIGFERITINFNSSKSYMRTGYRLRKGIEFGHTKNGYVKGCIFKNGDLSCAIATGHGNRNISSNIRIYNNKFIDLIKSDHNEDHTSVYINSQFSEVYHNEFTNNSIQGKLVACATELHNSNTKFYNNTVIGYTRMMFLVAIGKENEHITNLKIYDNNASITNAAIYLWLEKNGTINNLFIENNKITSRHIEGYSMAQNGTQGLLADSKDEDNTEIKNMIVKNNTINITNTVFRGRAVKYATKYKFKDIGNICINCSDGDYYKN